MFTLTFTFRKFQKMLTVLYKYITDQKKKMSPISEKAGFFFENNAAGATARK